MASGNNSISKFGFMYFLSKIWISQLGNKRFVKIYHFYCYLSFFGMAAANGLRLCVGCRVGGRIPMVRGCQAETNARMGYETSQTTSAPQTLKFVLPDVFYFIPFIAFSPRVKICKLSSFVKPPLCIGIMWST